MKSENTATRLQELMKRRNLRQVDILELARPFCDKYEVKLNKSDLSQYVSGKVEPGQDKLFILGRALGVSEAWLMGYDVPESRDAEIPAGDPELDNAVLNIESERLSQEWLVKFQWVHSRMSAIEEKVRYLPEEELERLFPVLESTVNVYWEAFMKEMSEIQGEPPAASSKGQNDGEPV